MPVRTIGHDEAAARRQHRKTGRFGAATYADATSGGEVAPQQRPPALSSQEEYPSLERKTEPCPIARRATEPTQPSRQRRLKRLLFSSTPSFRGAVARAGGNTTDPGPIGSKPMHLTNVKRRAPSEPPQQLYPAPGPMCSGAQVPFGQTPKAGSGEFYLPEGSLPGGKGEGEAPSYSSQGGAYSQSTLTLKAVPFPPWRQQAHRMNSQNSSLTSTPSTERSTLLNFQNQSLHLPVYPDSMTSLPITTAPRSVPNYGSSSLPNTPTASMNGRDLAIYRNAVLVAGAQKEHEEKMGGLHGQDLGISSTNPDGHYVCGQVLQDMKIRNEELKAEVQAIRAKEEELKHENNAIKDHISAMEATLLSIGPQKTISLGDFTNMMGEMAHLHAVAEYTEPMVKTVHGYQQEIAVLRARLLANGIDPSITATPVVPARQEPITTLSAAARETPVSRSIVAVSNSISSEENYTRFPSNKFFIGEFGIHFRSIANLGRCNYQFTRQIPVTTVQIPPQVREKLKVIVQGNEPLLNWLLDDTNKTKFLLVSGLFARLICSEVIVETFVDELILKIGEAPSEKARILSGWVQGNPEITNRVWPVLTDVSETLGRQLHDKYVSLLSRPTDARHLEESLRSLVGCIEHAARLALKMDHLGWGNWRFVFHGTASPFQSAKMTICDLGTEGLFNFGHDTRILEEKEAKIKFCVFPMIYRRDIAGAWKVLVKATTLV
ncbi:hypothetical protein B9Z19DRAFT_1060817 [Tuber borchii]|uniref:Uncharacterized protein n=1 Tax=Tuber borchii TaxID=42251 RepID=A0A2T7A7J6_TUBBO|nr:hypothetical protein B9Z19DRAFT_1060817 [Tuber borchii]